MIKAWDKLSIESPLYFLGPHFLSDDVGFQLALAD